MKLDNKTGILLLVNMPIQMCVGLDYVVIKVRNDTAEGKELFRSQVVIPKGKNGMDEESRITIGFKNIPCGAHFFYWQEWCENPDRNSVPILGNGEDLCDFTRNGYFVFFQENQIKVFEWLQVDKKLNIFAGRFVNVMNENLLRYTELVLNNYFDNVLYLYNDMYKEIWKELTFAISEDLVNYLNPVYPNQDDIDNEYTREEKAVELDQASKVALCSFGNSFSTSKRKKHEVLSNSYNVEKQCESKYEKKKHISDSGTSSLDSLPPLCNHKLNDQVFTNEHGLDNSYNSTIKPESDLNPSYFNSTLQRNNQIHNHGSLMVTHDTKDTFLKDTEESHNDSELKKKVECSSDGVSSTSGFFNEKLFSKFPHSSDAGNKTVISRTMFSKHSFLNPRLSKKYYISNEFRQHSVPVKHHSHISDFFPKNRKNGYFSGFTETDTSELNKPQTKFCEQKKFDSSLDNSNPTHICKISEKHVSNQNDTVFFCRKKLTKMNRKTCSSSFSGYTTNCEDLLFRSSPLTNMSFPDFENETVGDADSKFDTDQDALNDILVNWKLRTGDTSCDESEDLPQKNLSSSFEDDKYISMKNEDTFAENIFYSELPSFKSIVKRTPVCREMLKKKCGEDNEKVVYEKNVNEKLYFKSRQNDQNGLDDADVSGNECFTQKTHTLINRNETDVSIQDLRKIGEVIGRCTETVHSNMNGNLRTQLPSEGYNEKLMDQTCLLEELMYHYKSLFGKNQVNNCFGSFSANNEHPKTFNYRKNEKYLTYILGEFQYAYISFFLGLNNQSFLQYKRLLNIFSNLSVSTIFFKYPFFYASFIRTFYSHLSQLPRGIQDEQTFCNNFFFKELFSVLDLGETTLSADYTNEQQLVLKRFDILQRFVKKKFGIRNLDDLLIKSFSRENRSEMYDATFEFPSYLTNLDEDFPTVVDPEDLHSTNDNQYNEVILQIPSVSPSTAATDVGYEYFD